MRLAVLLPHRLVCLFLLFCTVACGSAGFSEFPKGATKATHYSFNAGNIYQSGEAGTFLL